jgi:hypothetical protein
MHWILAVTLGASATALMGSFDSEEACLKAREDLIAMADPKKLNGAMCVREDNRILKIFQR